MDEGLPSVSIIVLAVILLIDIFVQGYTTEDDSEHEKSMQFLTIVVNMLLGGIVTYGLSSFIIKTTGVSYPLWTERLIYVLTGILIALIIMCFGIIIPRRLALRNPEKWAKVCRYPVSFFKAICYPFVFVANALAAAILYVFGVRGDDNLSDVTEEEIKSMVTEGQEQGVLQETEADMISNIFEFSDKEAQDIMTNRNNMVAIDANMSLKEAVNFMMDTNNSRFPVYLDDIDHIIGIMHIRDAMKKLSEETDSELPIRKIKGLLRQPKFVPETRNIDSLFHGMQSSKTQMVIIIDEYGQTVGLVSMEDILEEIVGNILDEYDEDVNYIKPTRNSGEYIVDGKTPIEVLEKRFDLDFEETQFETINGYLISKLDRIPEEDVEFAVNVGSYSFKILSVKNHMIQEILVNKLPEEVQKEDEELAIAK
jgi:putative hemolysin